MPTPAASPTPLSHGDEADVLAVVARLCQVVGVPYDGASARVAFRQACVPRDLPDWAAPLGHACRAVGMRARPWTGSVRDAWEQARRDLPMVTALVGPDGALTWVVVGGRWGRKVELWEPTGQDERRRLGFKAFVQRVGLGGADRLLPWMLVEPVAPATEMLGTPGAGIGVFGRLQALLRAERQDLWVILAYAVGIGILGLATPLVVQVLVNTVAFTAMPGPVFVLAGLLLACSTNSASHGVTVQPMLSAIWNSDW